MDRQMRPQGAFGYLWVQQKGTKGLLVFLLLTIG